MEHRSFADGARVSVLGIGCGRVASINNPVPMREIEATLEAAVAAGINLFDAADVYAQGDSERTLSRLLSRHRDRMFVFTKVGYRHGRLTGAVRFAKPVLRALVRVRPQLRGAVIRTRAATVTQNFDPADLRSAVESCRRRLRVDRLDGLFLHDPSFEALANPKIHDFLDELLLSGRAARVGASVPSLLGVEAALSIPRITILQVPIMVAAALPGTSALESIRRRKIGLFVRDVLRCAGLGEKAAHSVPRSLSAAIAPDFVTAAIVGVSTRRHLGELLSAVA